MGLRADRGEHQGGVPEYQTGLVLYACFPLFFHLCYSLLHLETLSFLTEYKKGCNRVFEYTNYQKVIHRHVAMIPMRTMMQVMMQNESFWLDSQQLSKYKKSESSKGTTFLLLQTHKHHLQASTSTVFTSRLLHLCVETVVRRIQTEWV